MILILGGDLIGGLGRGLLIVRLSKIGGIMQGHSIQDLLPLP